MSNLKAKTLKPANCINFAVNNTAFSVLLQKMQYYLLPSPFDTSLDSFRSCRSPTLFNSFYDLFNIQIAINYFRSNLLLAGVRKELFRTR